MKNIHYIIAHPNKDSLNFAMMHHTTKALHSMKAAVTITDLYRMYRDQHPSTKPYGSTRTAQEAALIREQQNIIKESNLTIIQLPLYWFSFPSVLHAYWEQVLEPGFAYPGKFNQSPLHDGRQIIFNITTQSQLKDYSESGKIGDIKNILHPLFVMFSFCWF